MNSIQLFGVRFVSAIILTIALNCTVAAEESATGDAPRAYMTAHALLLGWESTYGDIRNLDVSYSAHSEKFIPPSTDPKMERWSCEWFHVDFLGDNIRYVTRFSSSEKGFADEKSIVAGSFSGNSGMQYLGATRKGEVGPGKPGSNQCDQILNWLFLQGHVKSEKLQLSKPRLLSLFKDLNAPGAPMLTGVIVRPRLEQVAGQWCHVIERTGLPPEQTRVAWLAHERGMVLMKVVDDVSAVNGLRLEVKELKKSQFGGGELWYPQKARIIQSFAGTEEYALDIHRFRLNIELQDSMFKLEFPKGTRIYDANLDIIYTAGADPAKRAESQIIDMGKVRKGVPVGDHLAQNSLDKVFKSPSVPTVTAVPVIPPSVTTADISKDSLSPAQMTAWPYIAVGVVALALLAAVGSAWLRKQRRHG